MDVTGINDAGALWDRVVVECALYKIHEREVGSGSRELVESKVEGKSASDVDTSYHVMCRGLPDSHDFDAPSWRSTCAQQR